MQDPEILAQELAASLNRCVSRSWAAGQTGRAGLCENPRGALCAAERRVYIRLQVKYHAQVGGGGKEDWIGSGYELPSPHPCARALGLREQLQSLREELEQVAQKGRARCAQSAELNNDLCKAHRWVSLPWVSPCDLRSVPGSPRPAAFPCKVGGRSSPSCASPLPHTQCLPAPF